MRKNETEKAKAEGKVSSNGSEEIDEESKDPV